MLKGYASHDHLRHQLASARRAQAANRAKLTGDFSEDTELVHVNRRELALLRRFASHCGLPHPISGLSSFKGAGAGIVGHEREARTDRDRKANDSSTSRDPSRFGSRGTAHRESVARENSRFSKNEGMSRSEIASLSPSERALVHEATLDKVREVAEERERNARNFGMAHTREQRAKYADMVDRLGIKNIGGDEVADVVNGIHNMGQNLQRMADEMDKIKIGVRAPKKPGLEGPMNDQSDFGSPYGSYGGWRSNPNKDHDDTKGYRNKTNNDKDNIENKMIYSLYIHRKINCGFRSNLRYLPLRLREKNKR